MKLTSNFLTPLDASLPDPKPYGAEKPVRYERSDGDLSAFERSRRGALMHRQFRVWINQLKNFLAENAESDRQASQSAREGLEEFGQRVREGSSGHYGPLIRTLAATESQRSTQFASM
jgi:hypothetical protein